jgi:tetratricopeptide (TPR) repeat protein
MKIEKIIEKLSGYSDSRSLMNYVFDLKYDLRFNTLREIIYHIDIYIAEKNQENAEKMLNTGDKLNDLLDAGHKFQRTEEYKNFRTLRTIAKKKMAKFLESRGDSKGAIEQYGKILSDLNLPEEEAFHAEILMEIGIIEEQNGKKKEAIAKFEKAAKIYKEKRDDFNFLAALFNSAHVLYDIKQYRQAESFCKSVIKHYGETGKVQSPVAHAYLEMANIYEIKEKDPEARTFYNKALDSYQKLNERAKISDILNRIAAYEMENNHNASAASLMHESLDLKRTIDFQQGKASYCFIMAENLRECGSPESALDYYNLAYHYYSEAGIESRKLQIKHCIFKCLKALEQFEPKHPKTKLIDKLERINYRNFNSDGYSLSNHKSWKYSDRAKVNRKFLVYLLRNLSKVYIKLGNDKEYFKYQNLLTIVESDNKKNK